MFPLCTSRRVPDVLFSGVTQVDLSFFSTLVVELLKARIVVSGNSCSTRLIFVGSNHSHGANIWYQQVDYDEAEYIGRRCNDEEDVVFAWVTG